MAAARRSVLMVEDDELIGLAGKRALELEGYVVRQVFSGEDAIGAAVAADAPVDLVLMDIDLGRGIDGPEAARRILERRDVPVVFWSAHAEREVLERTEQIASYGFVLKGSGITVLDACLKQALRLHQAYHELEEKEAALDRSEAHYRSLFEHSPIGIVEEDFSVLRARMVELHDAGIADLGDYLDAHPAEIGNLTKLIRIRDANTEYLKMLGVTRKEEITGNLVYIMNESHARSFRNEFVAFYEGKTSFDTTIPLSVVSETTAWVKLRISIVEGHETDWSRVLLSFVDVTDEKRAETAAARALAEKNALYRELQHRVKNNLNIISSLLSLEGDRTTDEKLIRIFGDTQARIRSIATIYDLFSRSADPAGIDFDQYLRELANLLYAAYVTDAGRIRLVLDLEPVRIDTKRAATIGLFANELMTNAFKYAFPAGRPGEIVISITIRNNAMVLRVADSGVGLPPCLDWKTTDSLGYQLVRMLAGQADGTVEIESAAGVTATGIFPLR